MYEGQTDTELTHTHRLYRSAELTGPWESCRENGSALYGLKNQFGGSLIVWDMENGKLSIMAPFTEAAGSDRQLSFPGFIDITL